MASVAYFMVIKIIIVWSGLNRQQRQVIASVQFLVIEIAGATSIWFGLVTFFGPKLVHTQHVGNIGSEAYGITQVTGWC